MVKLQGRLQLVLIVSYSCPVTSHVETLGPCKYINFLYEGSPLCSAGGGQCLPLREWASQLCVIMYLM